MIDIYYFDGEVKKGDIKKIDSLISHPVWIDVTKISKEESQLLKSTFNLHPLTSEDLIHKQVRVKVEQFPKYLFGVFYGIRNLKSFNLFEFDLIIGNNFIISNHYREIESITQLKNDTERLENLFIRGIDFIFHKILDLEVDNFVPILEHIDDKIETIEEQVTEKPHPELLKKILELKRLIIHIRKTTIPQRDKIYILTKSENKFISRKCIPYFRDIFDHAIRVSDMVDNYREAVSNTFDLYMSSVSNKMNEVMKVLSVIATIALPLTVISGIYGTNFASLPGSGFAYGFWVMILGMVLLSVVMLYYFKRRGWF